MRLIMTGGGTGGHIYPAIAIADRIRKEEPESEILFVGTEHGLEKEIVPKNGYRIEFIKARGLSRSKPLSNFRTFKEYEEGLHRSKAIMREFKPDAVIGTGGYVCAAVIRAAHQMGAACYIHEQNAFAGLTNKLLESSVRKVFISFPEAEKYFKNKGKLALTGNPVRDAFRSGGREEARERLGIAQDEFVVLSVGGSLGAERINSAVSALAPRMTAGSSLYISSGKRYFESMKGLESENVHVREYMDDIDEYIKAANLVISRSGALALSELLVCGRASVLVPSPNVTGNHQYFNAKSAADRGAAILIEEKELSDEALADAVLSLRAEPERIAEMERAALGAAPGDACGLIYDIVKNG